MSIRTYTPGTRKPIFVSGKYRDARGEYYVLRNILAAQEVGLELARMDYSPFIPHCNSFLCNGALPDDYIWLDIDQEFLFHCQGLVNIPGWQESEGSRDAENPFALEHGIPVFDWSSKAHREFLMRAAHDPRTLKQQLMEEQ